MKLIKNLSYCISPLIIVLFNILIIFEPNLVIDSAREGLLLWFNKVIPSIFPFLVGTNLLIQLGFIDFLGTLLENFMKKFFNVSGCGAFALILGMFSGYPVGSKITASLRETNKISQIEAQRLASFTNNSGPLFIIGTVGLGMFNNIKIGYFILFIHYISAITVGILFRFYKNNKILDKSNILENKQNNISLHKAFVNLKNARIKTNKKFGEILSDSVQNSLETITTIGGFIIIFSVIGKILESSNIFNNITSYIFSNNKYSLIINDFSNSFFVGIVEITNGIYNISKVSADNINNFNYFIIGVILTSGLVSFSGLSILAQTVSLLSKTDINIGIYILSKLMHSIISIFYSILSIPIIHNIFITSELNTTETFNPNNIISSNNFNTIIIKNSMLMFLFGLFCLVVISTIFLIISQFNINKKTKSNKI